MNLLQTLTLGTARLPVTPEVDAYLALRDAVDPTADDAEKALAAYALTERLDRLRTTRTAPPTGQEPIPETRPTPSPRLTRALPLIFQETYAAVLPEAIRVLYDRELIAPPHLLPGLLTFAASGKNQFPDLADLAMIVGGDRARWLAGLNPEWATLAESYDHQMAWAKEISPAGKRDILVRWRLEAPEAARAALTTIWKEQSPKNQETLVGALQFGLNETDIAWLKERLAPKRKGVRRAFLHLLLLAGDEKTTERIISLATHSLTETGAFVNILKDPDAKEALKTYGGLKGKESIGEFLLQNLRPNIIPDLLGQALPDFWAGITKGQLKAAATAILDYDDLIIKEAFLAYALIARQDRLPVSRLSTLVEGLPQESFERVYHEYMDREREGFSSGNIAPLLAVFRREPWSERISKSFVRALVGRLKANHSLPYSAGREQGELWKRATPLLHVNTFDFLRQHLHSMTERPDQFGKLSLEMLQTTAFRRVLYNG